MNLYYKTRAYLGKKKKSILEKIENGKWNSEKIIEIIESKQELRRLKNIHQGKRCFIIGNGPSINNQDLKLLKNEFSIGSNSFFLKHKELGFVPQYYTVEDHLVAEDNFKEINDLEGCTKFFPYDLRYVLKKQNNSVYVNLKRAYVIENSLNFPFFSTDVLDKAYWGGTVLFMSIQMAYHLGFKEIYLIGVDLTYDIPDSVKQKGSVLTSTEDDTNHFDSSYFGAGKRWHLPEVDRMQISFSKAYEELKKQDVKLINATLKGNLEKIPRVDYCSLF